MELSQAAQHWADVVLIWIGFGSLAGLLARVVLPVREPSEPPACAGPGNRRQRRRPVRLSWGMGPGTLNPISPLGFFAAGGGALVLLVLYQVVHALLAKTAGDGQPSGEKPYLSPKQLRVPSYVTPLDTALPPGGTCEAP